MKQILFSISLLLASVATQSQNFLYQVIERFSFEGFAGFANYQGELQESVYTFSQAKPAFSLGGRIELADRVFLRGLATYGKISASDKYARSLEKRKRNLDFSSAIYDASITGVYEVFNIAEKRYTPYIFAGVSLFHFSPYTYDSTGTLRWLMPLGTEGQGLAAYPDRKLYNLNQFSIPFGAGIKFAVNKNIAIGWEFRFNKTFTDYLDDVSTTYADYNILITGKYGVSSAEMAYRGDELKGGSQTYPAAGTKRGNPKTKDWYYFSGITITYTLFPKENFSGNQKALRDLRCPVNVF
ncbi:MAG: outer membrane beta-barrel protein [Bacteroidetes bacterium]|nr:outer membrane beta-barrel protein [Bacteroidota bacterium]